MRNDSRNQGFFIFTHQQQRSRRVQLQCYTRTSRVHLAAANGIAFVAALSLAEVFFYLVGLWLNFTQQIYEGLSSVHVLGNFSYAQE